MNKQSAEQILVRYRANSCTPAEQRLVENWVMDGAASVFDLSDDQLLEDLLDIRLRLERDLRKERSPRVQSFGKWFLYAAAVLLMGAIGGWALWDNLLRNSDVTSLASEDILPGGNHATLTLGNGKKIDLNAMYNEIIIGDEITYTDGSAIFSAEQQGKNQDTNAVKDQQFGAHSPLLTLSTPKGGSYQVTLSDGSKIWLNADSKLTYPARFDEDKRMVELEGEAYFEITKRHKALPSSVKGRHSAGAWDVPFHVKTHSQVVEVLGTRFNISAYGDEPAVKTTLVEGGVKVALTNRTSSVILKPGQQSVVVDDQANVSDVDVSYAIGWTAGYFIFNGTELPEAMKQISRWYNLEISYEGTIPRTPFYGKISRHDTLTEVISILKAANIMFRIERKDGINRLIVL